MKLIVGLGNPEASYVGTRHNLGASLVRHFAQAHRGVLQQKSKFNALVAELSVDGQKVLAVLPTTYYNASGDAVQAIASFYRVPPEDILIVHDELALPFGSIRTRYGGADAGNNGVKSVTARVGEATARIRVGIYNDLRDRMDDADFVLSKFSKAEQDAMPEVAILVASGISQFVAGALAHTTHSLQANITSE